MTAALITLGCKVNTYESNVVMNQLKEKGYEIVDSKEVADIYIINTCTVTNKADKKSKQTIRKVKKLNKNSVIIAMGCLTQVNKGLQDVISEIDIQIGNKHKTKISEFIDIFLNEKKKQNHVENIIDSEFEDMKAVDFKNQTRAFVKIEDGCENYCSYCIIPFARGKVRSKNPENVIKEIKELVSKGYKEVVLTGIHTGHYGSDLQNYNFNDLLKDIIKIKRLKRLRISSIEIKEVTDEIIKTIKDSKVIARHLHIPLQSGCDKTLKDMDRRYDTKSFKKRLDTIRKEIKDISITTDVIVGFPTETNKDYEATMDFINKIKFSNIHVFPFSLRKGTKAEHFKNIVKDQEKKERVKKLIRLSNFLEEEYTSSFLNKEVEVIFESMKEKRLTGHSSNYLKVVTKNKKIKRNEITKTKIKKIVDNVCEV